MEILAEMLRCVGVGENWYISRAATPPGLPPRKRTLPPGRRKSPIGTGHMTISLLAGRIDELCNAYVTQGYMQGPDLPHKAFRTMTIPRDHPGIPRRG